MSLGNRQYVERDEVLYENNAVPAPVVGATPVVARGASVSASGLAVAGIATILLGIWGGIIPFIGPSFGYSADGTTAWAMTSAHLWLAVIPGAVAFAAGCVLLMAAPRTVAGSGRGELGFAGLAAVLAGAWFVFGPFSWPVVTTARGYFLAAAPLRELGYLAGYGLGPGVLVILTGAFALGWSARHQFLTTSTTATRRRGMHSAATVAGQPVASPAAVPAYALPTVANPQVVTSAPVVSGPVATDQPVIGE
jgi:hypothetical protein